MSDNLKVDIGANASKALRELDKVDKRLDSLGRRAASAQARVNVHGRGVAGSKPGKSGASAVGNSGAFSGLLDTALAKIPGGGMLKGLLGGAGFSVAGITAGLGALTKSLLDMREAGAGVQAEFERMSVSLGVLSQNRGGTGNITALTNQIHDLAINGVNDIEQLRKSAAMFMAAFDGSQMAVAEWLPIVDDMAASLGIGVEELAKIVARANEVGKVEGGIFGTLKEKGLPVYRELAKILGVSAEEAKKLATTGQITAEVFNTTLKRLAGAFAGSSAALSTFTMQGARDTNTAAWGKRYQAVAAGGNAVMISHLNAESGNLLAEQLDLGRQAELKELGIVAGHLERIKHDTGKIFSLVNLLDKANSGFNSLFGLDAVAARRGGAQIAARYEGLRFNNATSQSLEEVILQAREDLKKLSYSQGIYDDADLQREFTQHIETLTAAINGAEKELAKTREQSAAQAREAAQKAKDQRATAYQRAGLAGELAAIQGGGGNPDLYANKMGWGNATDAISALQWYNMLLSQGEDGTGLAGADLVRFNNIRTEADALKAFNAALRAGEAARGANAMKRLDYRTGEAAAAGDMAAAADRDARAKMQALIAAGFSPAEAAAELAAWGKRSITSGARGMSFIASDGSRSLAVNGGGLTAPGAWLENAYGGRRAIIDQTATAEYQNAIKQTEYLRRIAENTGLLDTIQPGETLKITAQ